MKDLPWIEEGRKFLGLKEETGNNDHPKLDAGWVLYGASWLRGQAWCGLGVRHCLSKASRYVVPFWFRARAWESDKMTKLRKPAYGCIVTFTRDGGGHVGFIVGMDKAGNLMVLGGNQKNEVNISPFDVRRATGYYWPSHVVDGKPVKTTPLPHRYKLPKFDGVKELSTNEA